MSDTELLRKYMNERARLLVRINDISVGTVVVNEIAEKSGYVYLLGEGPRDSNFGWTHMNEIEILEVLK